MNEEKLELFYNDKVAVHTKTQKEYDDFMKYLEDNTDIRWHTSKKPTNPNNWAENGMGTLIYCQDGKLSYGDTFYNKANYYREYPVIKYKELFENNSFNIKSVIQQGMKTSEFVDKMKYYGYKVSVEGFNTFITFNRLIQAVIDNKSKNAIDIYGDNTLSDEVFDLIIQYAKTPVEEREEEPKYYWVISSKYYLSSEDDYFTLRADANKWYPYFKEESLMQKFTEKEFYKLEKELDIVGWFKRGERVE